MDIDLEQARRRAKELLRAARAGDPDAVAHLRGDRPPRLADAQRAIAIELGFRSWPALVRRVVESSSADRSRQAVLTTGMHYLPGRPIRVSVRRRGHRFHIDDLGAAVVIAGRPPGWLEAAERTVSAAGWNINREGVVSVSAGESRDIDALIQRTAEMSLAVLEVLLELEAD